MSHTIKLGVDIDGVLAKDSISKWVNRLAKTYNIPQLVPEKLYSYNLEVITGIPGDILIKEFDCVINNEIIEVSENASSVLSDLKGMGCEIVILTSRNFENYNVTKKWLKDNHVNHSKLIFTKGRGKDSFVEELGLDVVIDDNIMEYVNYNETKIDKIIFSQPWNRTYNLAGNFIIVNSWEEIRDEINNILQLRKIM